MRLAVTRLLLLSFLGLMFGLLFFDMDTSDVAGVNSMNGFLFVGPTFCAVLFMLTSVPFIARERAVFYRERASNTYSSFAYSTALLVAEIPFCIVYTIIHASYVVLVVRVSCVYRCGCIPLAVDHHRCAHQDHILDGWTEGRLGRVLALYACGCHPRMLCCSCGRVAADMT